MTAHELKQICQAAVQRSQVEQERPLDMSVTERGIQLGGVVSGTQDQQQSHLNSRTVCGTILWEAKRN